MRTEVVERSTLERGSTAAPAKVLLPAHKEHDSLDETVVSFLCSTFSPIAELIG